MGHFLLQESVSSPYLSGEKSIERPCISLPRKKNTESPTFDQQKPSCGKDVLPSRWWIFNRMKHLNCEIGKDISGKIAEYITLRSYLQQCTLIQEMEEQLPKQHGVQ